MATLFSSSFFSIAGQKERLANVVGVVNAAFNPFSKSTVEANVSNPTMKAALETVANHPYVSAGVIAGGVTAITKPAVALAAAKSAIPTTVKGKVIAAVAAPVVLGAVAKQPIKAISTAIKAPSELAEFGGGISTLLAEPSLASAKALFKESPLLTGATLAAGAVIAGKGIFPAIAIAQQTQAIQEQTEALRGATAGLATPSGGIPPTYATAPMATVPVTPPTQTVTAGAITRRKRRSLKKVMQGNISQRVNVLVSQNRNSITKKYLRRNVIAY
jgi:hypothetical protein